MRGRKYAFPRMVNLGLYLATQQWRLVIYRLRFVSRDSAPEARKIVAQPGRAGCTARKILERRRCGRCLYSQKLRPTKVNKFSHKRLSATCFCGYQSAGRPIFISLPHQPAILNRKTPCYLFLPCFLAARSSITACAAANRAIGTRNGDALT
jgi:hypothetical protein